MKINYKTYQYENSRPTYYITINNIMFGSVHFTKLSVMLSIIELSNQSEYNTLKELDMYDIETLNKIEQKYKDLTKVF